MLGGTTRRALPTPGRKSISEMLAEALPVTTLTDPAVNARSRESPRSDISGKRRKSDQLSWSFRHRSISWFHLFRIRPSPRTRTCLPGTDDRGRNPAARHARYGQNRDRGSTPLRTDNVRLPCRPGIRKRGFPLSSEPCPLGRSASFAGLLRTALSNIRIHLRWESCISLTYWLSAP